MNFFYYESKFLIKKKNFFRGGGQELEYVIFLQRIQI